MGQYDPSQGTGSRGASYGTYGDFSQGYGYESGGTTGAARGRGGFAAKDVSTAMTDIVAQQAAERAATEAAAMGGSVGAPGFGNISAEIAAQEAKSAQSLGGWGAQGGWGGTAGYGLGSGLRGLLDMLGFGGGVGGDRGGHDYGGYGDPGGSPT